MERLNLEELYGADKVPSFFKEYPKGGLFAPKIWWLPQNLHAEKRNFVTEMIDLQKEDYENYWKERGIKVFKVENKIKDVKLEKQSLYKNFPKEYRTSTYERNFVKTLRSAGKYYTIKRARLKGLIKGEFKDKVYTKEEQDIITRYNSIDTKISFWENFLKIKQGKKI